MTDKSAPDGEAGDGILGGLIVIIVLLLAANFMAMQKLSSELPYVLEPAGRLPAPASPTRQPTNTPKESGQVGPQQPEGASHLQTDHPRASYCAQDLSLRPLAGLQGPHDAHSLL